eukprot:GSChrysophyteH2.ASY1.ANO1.1086.1 assembled CDS
MQLTDKSLSTEQRKKLKKKLKKKKQQAKKKDKKRASKRNRRSDRPGIPGEGASSLSIEKADDAELEMRMMERDSNRYHANNNNLDADADATASMDMTADAKINGDHNIVAGAKNQGSKCTDVDAKADSKGVASDNDDNDEDELDAFANLNINSASDSAGAGGSSHSFPDPPLDVTLPASDLLQPEEIMMLMPPWLRPTWFAFLNFSGQEYDDDGDEEEIEPPSPTTATQQSEQFNSSHPNVQLISSKIWTKPSESSYSKLTMLVSTNRMIEAFGMPEERLGDGGNDDDLAYADWCFALGTRSSDENNYNIKCNQFLIRGQGIDKDDLTSLVGLSALNSLAYEGDKYYIDSHDAEGDQYVVWNIIHYHEKSKQVMAFLEKKLDGVKFMAHYDASHAQVISEEDDAELLYVMGQLIIHPACDVAEVNNSASYNDSRLFLKEGDGSGANPNPYTHSFSRGGGAMLGVDVAALSKSIRCATDDPNLPESERKSYDFTGYVHPLDRRYEYFLGNPEVLESALPLYNRINQTLLALGEGSDGASQESVFGENEAEQAPARPSTVVLDEEYTGAHVKIVDLGNACWTHKHYTEDIQTRQYRCPEVLLGCGYDATADMWSFACVVFELLTGDLLFDPRAGTKWDREEDHLAMMIELCGDFPKAVINSGKKAQQYFNKRGDLHNIHQLKYWPLKDVLHDKYRFSESDANEIASFLMPCLAIDRHERASASDCLSHPWIVNQK